MIPSFKDFLCSEASSSVKAKIKALIDGSDLIMFFEKKGNIYGTDENGRMVFAQMKNPSKDLTDDWSNDASFMATNLSNILKGGGTETVISKSELKKVKVIDGEEAYKKLLSQIESQDVTDPTIQVVSIKR